MDKRHLILAGLMALLALLGVATRPATPGGTGAQAAPLAQPAAPPQIVHPCSGIFAEPPFAGLAPLSITWVPGMCTADVFQAGYGDITVWQAAGHSYVGIAGFAQRAFYIFNVDDPYHPALLVNQTFPAGGTASLSIFSFRQAGNQYLSFSMRGSGTGCGFFVYNVNDPANPLLVGRKAGTDWCTVHEHFISTAANGDADYAWLTMSAESGSGYKIVVLDLRSLPTMTETGRYQRPDANSNIFAHDVTVIGNRVFIAHWGGGLIIQDKETLAHNTNPTPLNPIDSIRPSGFNVHHAWPTTDGNHVFIEDEFQNNPALEKIKLYNIADITQPHYETGIIGSDVAASNRAHNMKILNESPGHDLLFDGWYEGGTRGFEVDTTGATPVITQTLYHRLRQTTDGQFGDVWGVDFLPCTLRGQSRTCVYSSDMFYGLVADALGTDPALDPYPPTSTITDPLPGQTITTCKYIIQGTAHDYWAGLAGVEASTDNGATWLPAAGTATWTFAWQPPADGAYTLLSRATDLAGNRETPAGGVPVTVAGNCAAGTATPAPTTPPVTPAPPSATPVPPSATAAPPSATLGPASVTPAPPSTTPVPPSATPPLATATLAPPSATPAGTATPCAVAFSDVHPADYFATSVGFLACHGAISGYADGTFRPYAPATRAQLVKIVVLGFGRPLQTPSSGYATFSDVPPSHPFFAVIETAAAAGLVGGYTCGGPGEPCDPLGHAYFRPARAITRGQLAKIAVGAAGWPLRTPATGAFADVAPGSPFYAFVETAACYGLVSGYTCGAPGEPCEPSRRPYFRGGQPAARGQIAKIVYNAAHGGPACAPR